MKRKLTTGDSSIPSKRAKLDPFMDNSSLSTTTTILSSNSSINTSNKSHNNNNNKCDDMIDLNDLNVEYPGLKNIINSSQNDNVDLELDPAFDITQLLSLASESNTSNMPFIFDWKNLSPTINTQQLRTEALRKQERGKYVRRDSLSLEEAADRRRKQNRESARRTRDRVRKYITVLEMYYKYIQNINNLLTKQLELVAKHCYGELSDDDRKNLKIHEWPKQPTIEQCINAKPAIITATAYKKNMNISDDNEELNEFSPIRNNSCNTNSNSNSQHSSIDTNLNTNSKHVHLKPQIPELKLHPKINNILQTQHNNSNNNNNNHLVLPRLCSHNQNIRNNNINNGNQMNVMHQVLNQFNNNQNQNGFTVNLNGNHYGIQQQQQQQPPTVNVLNMNMNGIHVKTNNNQISLKNQLVALQNQVLNNNNFNQSTSLIITPQLMNNTNNNNNNQTGNLLALSSGINNVRNFTNSNNHHIVINSNGYQQILPISTAVLNNYQSNFRL